MENPPLVMANDAPWDGFFNPTLTLMIYSYMIPLSIRNITDFFIMALRCIQYKWTNKGGGCCFCCLTSKSELKPICFLAIQSEFDISNRLQAKKRSCSH